MPNLKIIGAVEHEIAAVDQRFDIRIIDVGNDRLDLYFRIDLSDPCFSRNCFWQALSRVAFFEQGLPLKVCEFDKIAVNDTQFANPSSSQHFGVCRTESTAADKQNTRI